MDSKSPHIQDLRNLLHQQVGYWVTEQNLDSSAAKQRVLSEVHYILGIGNTEKVEEIRVPKSPFHQLKDVCVSCKLCSSRNILRSNDGEFFCAVCCNVDLAPNTAIFGRTFK